MKIVLDCVVADKGKYIAYIQLQDDNKKVLSTTSVPYEEGETALLKQMTINKFRGKVLEQINKEKKIKEIKADLEMVLSKIDVIKEVK